MLFHEIIIIGRFVVTLLFFFVFLLVERFVDRESRLFDDGCDWLQYFFVFDIMLLIGAYDMGDVRNRSLDITCHDFYRAKVINF